MYFEKKVSKNVLFKILIFKIWIEIEIFCIIIYFLYLDIYYINKIYSNDDKKVLIINIFVLFIKIICKIYGLG